MLTCVSTQFEFEFFAPRSAFMINTHCHILVCPTLPAGHLTFVGGGLQVPRAIQTHHLRVFVKRGECGALAFNSL